MRPLETIHGIATRAPLGPNRRAFDLRDEHAASRPDQIKI